MSISNLNTIKNTIETLLNTVFFTSNLNVEISISIYQYKYIKFKHYKNTIETLLNTVFLLQI